MTGGCPTGTPTGQGNIIVENKIGIGTTTPASMLTIEAQNATTPFVQVASSTNQNIFIIDKNGNVGLGTSTPAAQFAIKNLLFVGAGGATTMGTATSTFQGDVKITGKLDVSTIDPVYSIDGVKYATYGASTVGVKEEDLETLDLSNYDSTLHKYVFDITFDKLETGSNLWLFYQATNFGTDWSSLVVTLTPAFDGTVYYEKHPSTKTLRILSDKAGEVSMRLNANRFDSSSWPNFRPDQTDTTYKGFILNSK